MLIIGASARAAVCSALRAAAEVDGRPIAAWPLEFGPLHLGPLRAADLFADADLLARCPTTLVADYPEGFEPLFAKAVSAGESTPGQTPDLGNLAADPWLYTGGLENFPDLVDRLASRQPLLGNRGDILRRVRDPWALSAVLRTAGFATPEIAASPAGLPTDGSWLCKSLSRSGGGHVFRWTGPKSDRLQTTAGRYWQKYVTGTCCSATFVSQGPDRSTSSLFPITNANNHQLTPNRVQLLGVTRQLLSGPVHPAGEFAYSGSIGPWTFLPSVLESIKHLGHCLASEFQLVGLWGVDFILTDTIMSASALENEEPSDSGLAVARGAIVPIEINPRYPASVEVLERAGDFSAVAFHIAACRPGTLPPALPCSTGKTHSMKIVGKQIVYALRPMAISPRFADACLQVALAGPNPLLADIPHPGAQFNAGQPVLTVFADGATESAVSAALAARSEAIIADLK
jgi:predicted ATP-grasp superfamily ATP-dependent carboligase